MAENIATTKAAELINDIHSTVENSAAPQTLEIAEYAGQGALCPVQSEDQIVPIRPEHVDNTKDQEIGKKANAFLEVVRSDPMDYRIGNMIFQIGDTAMEATNVQVDLYNTHMGTVLSDINEGSPVLKDILSVKTHLDMISPSVLENTEMPFKKKALGLFTKTVMRLPKGDEILRIISERRETINSTVSGLRETIRMHSETIVRDAVQIGVVSDALKEAQLPLQEDIYLCQLIWKMLAEHLKTVDDDLAKETIRLHLSDLVASTVSMQSVDNLNCQVRYGGGLLIRNSNNVRRVIRSTDQLVGTVTHALGVRLVAARQIQTQQAMKTIQDAAYHEMEEAAKATGQAVVKSAEMNQQMMLNIESLRRSCEHFDLAAQKLVEVSTETIKVGTLASNALNEMNDKMRKRADAVNSMKQRRHS
jgi:hypothetical protein